MMKTLLLADDAQGGEAGISAVQCLEGDQIWAAAREGRWLHELGKAAMDVVDLVNPGVCFSVRQLADAKILPET